MKKTVALDYTGITGDAHELLSNLSGVAANGPHLWTVSDEGRTFECLQQRGDGYALVRQFRLDDVFADLPGDDERGGAAELDIESVDFADSTLWLCGSHCNVRKKPDKSDDGADRMSARIKSRPSRHFLASIEIGGDGTSLSKGSLAPYIGAGAVRSVLAADPYLAPFIDLPSKENGLDIEGLVINGDDVILGLRGPVLDGIAVAVHLSLDSDLEVKTYRLSFLDLGGLAIRDLTRTSGGLLLIAGPVGEADGPYRMYRWIPVVTDAIQRPDEIPSALGTGEKPEGICELTRDGISGRLVVYDSPRDSRISGLVYTADWFA